MEDIKIIKLDSLRWIQYKDLRLKALQLEPSAFGSSYEEEVVWKDEKWINTLKEIKEGKTQIGYFADVEGKLVGMMFAKFNQHIKMNHVALIVGVFVDPEFRGQGVAKSLMKTLLEDLESRPEIVRIWLDVECQRIPALNLYKSFGFRTIGTLEKSLKVNDKFYDYFEMEKIVNND